MRTFTEQLADPESLKVQFTTSAKAFSAGKNIYRGPNHHYGLNIVNDPSQSPIAGKVKVFGSPGDGRTIGDTHVYFLTSANRNRDWAWKLLGTAEPERAPEAFAGPKNPTVIRTATHIDAAAVNMERRMLSYLLYST